MIKHRQLFIGDPRISVGSIRFDEFEQPKTASRRGLWYSYATHGGKPCSHYIGWFEDALALALDYQRRYGGTLHIERCDQ